MKKILYENYSDIIRNQSRLLRQSLSTTIIFFVFLSALPLLSGCWDSTEIEVRAFVLAFGIDVQDDNFQFHAVIAQPDEGNNDNDDKDRTRHAEGRTLTEAIDNLNARSSRDIFLGQAKAIVFSKKVLEDQDSLNKAIHAIENRHEIDRSINVVATDNDIAEILTNSYYIVNFDRLAEKSQGRSFQKNFEAMMADLRSTGNTTLPKISIAKASERNEEPTSDSDHEGESSEESKPYEDGEIRVEGALTVSDFWPSLPFDPSIYQKDPDRNTDE